MKYFFCLLFSAVFLFSCKRDKKDTDTSSAKDAAKDYGTLFKVFPEQSIIYWTGSALTGSHNGSIKIKSGSMDIDSYGQLKGGQFTIDMNTITDIDISDPGEKSDLENHLKSKDFFDVESFPEADFHIISCASLADSLTNYLVHGTLTMKGVEKELDVKAKVIYSPNTTLINVPEFTIDRTLWGVDYHSSKMTDIAKDQLISDNIGISIKLLLTK